MCLPLIILTFMFLLIFTFILFVCVWGGGGLLANETVSLVNCICKNILIQRVNNEAIPAYIGHFVVAFAVIVAIVCCLKVKRRNL